MPSALTPALALAYVRELSADVRAVAALDARGAPLAGEPAVAAAAGALLDAWGAGRGGELELTAAGGVVCAVRGEEAALVAACGPFALGAVVRSDLRAALAALEGREPPAGPPPAAPAPAPAERLQGPAEAVISAAQRASRA